MSRHPQDARRSGGGSPPQFFLFGYNGWKNTGDDAMLLALLLACRNLRVGFRVLCGPAAPAVPSETRGQVRVVPASALQVLLELARSDGFVLVGGTHLSDYGDRLRGIFMITRILALASFSKFLGKSVHLLAIGVGPIQARLPKVLARRLFRSADTLSVRDCDSLTAVESISPTTKAVLGFDLSALLVPSIQPTSTVRRSEEPILGVSITPVYKVYFGSEALQAQMLSCIASELNGWLRENPLWRIRVFIFQGETSGTANHDAFLSNMLRNLLVPKTRVEMVEYQPSPIKMLERVAACDAFIGMKFHASAFAFLCGVPQLLIPYHPKCLSLAREVGLPQEAIVPLEELASGRLRRQLDIITAVPDKGKSTLTLGEAIRRAQKAVDVLAKETVL